MRGFGHLFDQHCMIWATIWLDGWMDSAGVSYIQLGCHGIEDWVLRQECDNGLLMYDYQDRSVY